MNTNTDTTQPLSPTLKSAEISHPPHIPTAPADKAVETNESSGTDRAAGHPSSGQEPERIQKQPVERPATNDRRDEPGMALEPAARGREATRPSIAPSEISNFARAAADEPPNESNAVPPIVDGATSAARTTSIAPSETPPMASGGLAASIRESNAALSQLLGELAGETRQAAAAHGDSLRAIHGAIHELRRAHQEVVSRLNQPQGQ